MAKLLRVLIIVLLVLSLGALALGLIVFGQRREIKGRTQVLEKQVLALAENIEAQSPADLKDKSAAKVKLSLGQIQRYYQLDANGKPAKDATGNCVTTGTGTMDQALGDLVTRARIQMSRLNDTRDALKQTEDSLAQTRSKLQETETALSAARKTIAANEATIASQTEDINQKTAEIGSLKEDKESLQTKVDDQGNQIVTLQDKANDLQTQLEATKRYVDKVEKELAQYKSRAGAGPGEPINIPPGLKGRIARVSEKWNFVILDLPPKVLLQPAVDLMVQRKDKLVGKVRVSEIKGDQNLAVAEILTDWKQLPIKEGDYVFY